MRKAVFFDRDGVINVDHGYVGKISDFEFLDGVFTTLSAFRRLGYLLILTTNQSGIARGFYTEEDFLKLSDYMQSELQKHDAAFDGIYYCPHHPNAQVLQYKKECYCRKPKPGMFLEAIAKFDIDVNQSAMVGDHAGDLIAAKTAGISRLFLVGNHIQTEKIKVPECICCTSLSECLNYF